MLGSNRNPVLGHGYRFHDQCFTTRQANERFPIKCERETGSKIPFEIDNEGLEIRETKVSGVIDLKQPPVGSFAWSVHEV